MENQRKEARAAALAQEKKNNTSMVVGAAALGVPKADPNMESAKIANRLSYQPTSTAQNTYTPMSQPVKQPAAQQSVKPTTIQEPKPVTFSNIGTNNYLLSDSLKQVGESAKATYQNTTTIPQSQTSTASTGTNYPLTPTANYLGLSDNLRKAGNELAQNLYTERLRWVYDKKMEQEAERYNERMRWVESAMESQQHENKSAIDRINSQISDLSAQLESWTAALQAGDISETEYDEMNLQGEINRLTGERLALEERGRDMARRRWEFDNKNVDPRRQQYLLNYDVGQGKTQVENLSKREAELSAQIAMHHEKIASYGNLNMTLQFLAEEEILNSLQSQLETCKNQRNKIQQENVLAEHLQTSYGYMSLTKSSDFAYFSAKGAAMPNPSYDDVDQKWGNKEKYVTNIVTFSLENRDRIIVEEVEHHSAIGSSMYGYMTADEIGIYNYLLAKEGKEPAQKYLDHLEETLNARHGYEQGERIRSIKDNTGRILMTGLYGFGSGVDQFISGMRQWFSSERLPTSSTQYGSQYIRSSLSDVGTEILGNSAGQMFYDGTVTMGNLTPSVLVGSVLGSGAGSAAVGLSASGNAYAQALAQGYSKGQAYRYSVVVGASEAALQNLLGGIDELGAGLTGKLAKSIEKIDNSLLKMAVNGALDVLGEGSEEYLQALLEPVYGNIILGQNNQFEPFSQDKVYQAVLGAITAAGTNSSTNVMELLTLEGRQAAGLQKVDRSSFIGGFDADGTKKTAPLMVDGENFTEPISIEDTEEQRYQKLEDRAVLVIPYDAGKLQKIETQDYAKLKETACSSIYDTIKKLGEEYSLYKEYRNLDVQAEFAFSGRKMDESSKKQKTDFQNYAKVLTVFDQVVEHAVCIKKEADRYSLPNSNTDYFSIFVSAVDIRDGEKKKPNILPVLLAAKTFTDGTKSVLHMVISLPEIKGSSIVGHNLTANAVQPYPLGALKYRLADLFANVNPYGWNKEADLPDGRFLKYVPNGFLDEMQRLAKEYALIGQQQYDRRKTIEKYEKMKRMSQKDEEVLQQLIAEKEIREPKENARLAEIISQFRELAGTDKLAEKWLRSFEEEMDRSLVR